MRHLLVSALAAVILLGTLGATAKPAEAYLSKNNAISRCYTETAGDIPLRIENALWGGDTDAWRYGPRDVVVRVRWFRGDGVARFYDCRFIADDWYGGITRVSYMWVSVAAPYFSNVSAGCWKQCYYYNGESRSY